MVSIQPDKVLPLLEPLTVDIFLFLENKSVILLPSSTTLFSRVEPPQKKIYSEFLFFIFSILLGIMVPKLSVLNFTF